MQPMFFSRYFNARVFGARYFAPTVAAKSAKAALYAQQTEEVFLAILTITHPNLAPPIRVVNNTQDITVLNSQFKGFPFEIDLPGQGGAKLVEVTLRIDNVDRSIVQTLRSISTAPNVELAVVMASTPDTLEAGPYDFTLRDASYDALIIEGTLAFEDILNEAFPAHSFTPATNPGLFG